MISAELDNLARIGQLKREPSNARELAGLLLSGERRLVDARRADLAFDSRFDLGYNAAHSLALYALRRMGYRSDNRYLGTSINPNSVAIRRCSRNFNAYISNICGALKFLSRLVSLRILN